MFRRSSAWTSRPGFGSNARSAFAEAIRTSCASPRPTICKKLISTASSKNSMSTNERADESLGLNAPISRRDFLNGALLASAGLRLNFSPLELLAQTEDFNGYGGVGDYSKSNGNTREVLLCGHQIRDGRFNSLPGDLLDIGEIYDCVIVGGGISGLAAALFFQRLAGPGKTCLVLDNHAIFGGEAKRNEFLVDGHRLLAHQGSAFFPVPYPRSFIARFYESIGMKSPRFEYQRWSGSSPERSEE